MVDGEAIVSLRPGVAREQFIDGNRLQLVDALTFGDDEWLLVRSLDQPSAVDLVQQLRSDSGNVEWSEPNFYLESPEKPGEPMVDDDGDGIFLPASDYLNQPAVGQVELAASHQFATGSGIKIALLDTGLNSEHPAFAGGNIVMGNGDVETRDGKDTDGDGRKDEAYGHGTHVAGIVRLAAPGATLIVIKVMDDDGWGGAWGVIKGIVDAVDRHGANVINCGFGLSRDFRPLALAIRYASYHDVVVVAPAGNNGNNAPRYPAAWTEVISVTSVDKHDKLADFSNWHPTVDLSAPGVSIVSAMPAPAGLGVYAMSSGGSMATAWVSAAAALVRQRFPGEPAEDVANRLRTGSVPIDDSHTPGQIGSGRLSMLGALTTSIGEPIFP